MPNKFNISSLQTLIHPNTDVKIGMVWFIFTGLQSVLVNTMMRFLSDNYGYHAFQLVFFYSSMAAIMYLPSMIRNPSLYNPKERKKLYIIRGTMEVVGFSLIFYSLSQLPFAMVTVLSFVTPVFSALAAMFFLKEHMTAQKWVGMILGFSGVLVVVRPGGSNIGWEALFPIAAAAAFAVCVVCIRLMARTEPPVRIACVTLAIMACISLPLALPYWKMPALSHAPWFIILALQVAAVQYSIGKALQKIDLTIAQPLMFLNLIWSSAIGYFLFNEMVNHYTVIGAMIIITGIVYSIRRKFTRLDPVIIHEVGSANIAEDTTKQ
jgi:drug/metabolite transporter (DMT)-like permease